MYRVVCILCALLCLALFPVLLFASGLYVESYGIGADAGAGFLGRRASPMFAGLAVLLWLARDLEPGRARDAVCFGMAIMWTGIALTGLYELAFGAALNTIGIAAIVELGFAAAFLMSRTR